MKEYLLIGNNIDGSFSPLLHNYLINKLKIDAIYKLKDISNHSFDKVMKKILLDKNILGFNVTIPYKVAIVKYIDILDESSEITGSVNCVLKRNNKTIGYNTDVYGFERDIEDKVSLEGLNVGILGFGGSSRAIISSLLNHDINKLIILSRNIEKTRQFVNKWSIIKNSKVRVGITDSFEDKEFLRSNLIINCTPVRNPEINPERFEKLSFFYDLNYYNLNKSFIKMLNSSRVDYFEGGRMLVYQAAKSFEIWFNRSVSITDMIDLFYREIE